MKNITRLFCLYLALISIISLNAEVQVREFGNLRTEDIPEIPRRISEKFQRYHQVRSASLRDWDPAGPGMLIATRFGDTTQLHYVEKPGGARRQITFFEEPAGNASMCPDPARRGFLFTRDVGGGEFLRLKYYDVSTKNFTDLTADILWNVSEIALSANGDKLAFTINEDGIEKLYLLDTDSRKYEQVPSLPIGQISSLKFHRDGLRLALVLNTPISPSDVYALNLSDNSLVRWTYSETGGLPPDSFAVPDLIHFETFDKVDGHPRKIPAFYYRPSKGDGPYPVLVNIHGGPASQTVPRFSPAISYYVNELGVAVISPNVRGSNGYGKSYLLLDNGFKREDSVKDIGSLLDWIAQQPELDAERIAVVGGSYGGYMVLASMVHYNERLRCGIERYGISNFVTFLENTQSYRRDRRRKEYGDERNRKMRKFLEGIAPAAHADKITRPMLVAQGLNDPRVPPSESEQMVAAIRDNGGVVWYMLADNEGHGFKKKSNREYYNHAMALFLETYLVK